MSNILLRDKYEHQRQKKEKANAHSDRIMLQIPGLDFPQILTENRNPSWDTIYDSFDNLPVGDGYKDIGCHPHDRSHNNEIIELIDIIFVPQQLIQRLEPFLKRIGN
jgi:hypothetical protein